MRLYYPDGTVVRLESSGGPAFGGIFIGQQGKIEINRGRFACNPKNLLAPFTGSQTESHVANWLDCIETREQPNAPVEVGHLITSVAHLINIGRIAGLNRFEVGHRSECVYDTPRNHHRGNPRGSP